MMEIRKARAEEYASIAPLFLLAMEDIAYEFIGERSRAKAISLLENLIQKTANQYSHEHCWLVEKEDRIIGLACVYDGARLEEFREPVGKEIKALFNRGFNPEHETQAGEFYIDCVAVHPDYQGQGVGSKIFHFLIEEYIYKRNEVLGLLVHKENPKAKKLYLNLGFKFVGEKTLVGKELEHLQYKKHAT